MALDNFGQTNDTELAHLTLQTKKDLAKKIKKLIEPDGASSKALLKEINIRRLISSETTADLINGRTEIVQILECNYSGKTIARLMSKVEQCMVIDASICNLNSQKLYELFSKGNIIITSLTISELKKLVQRTDVEDDSCSNAKFLLLSFFDDTMSDLCIATNIKKTTYVDTHLLEFCNKHGYGLYTYDLFMGFRAHSYHGISKIVIFNYISTNHTYTPSCEGNSSDMIIDEDLANCDIKDIIATAEAIHGKRFILTRNFIEKVEHFGNRELAMFFLSDCNSKYTIYLDEKESTTICSVPHFANQTNSISLRKVPLTEKIWVIDDNGVQFPSTSKCRIKLKAGYTIIHGTNTLNNLYTLKVITIQKNKKSGILEYSCEFTTDTLDTVKKQYRSYANLLVMTT